MNKQVLDIEQMKHLQELGLKMELYTTLLCYVKFEDTDWLLETCSDLYIIGISFEAIPAYTLQDVLDLLPESITMDGEEYYLMVEKDAVMYVLWTGVAQMTKVFGKGKCINNPQALIDYAYEMLCWCIENGHVETMKHDKS